MAKLQFENGIHFDTERFKWVKEWEDCTSWNREEWDGKFLSFEHGAIIDGRSGNIVVEEEPRECIDFPWNETDIFIDVKQVENNNSLPILSISDFEINQAAATMGRKGGASKTEKKRKAVAENGKLGGRPSKLDKKFKRV